MAALLVALAVMGILWTVAMPTWTRMAKREKEAELVFRGEQYARAVGLYQRKFAGAFPPNLDVLLKGKFLRKKYTDPMTTDGEFQLLYQATQAPGRTPSAGATGQPGATVTTESPGSTSVQAGGQDSGSSGGALGPRGGIIGVTSKSKDESVRLYKGRNHYNEWQFVYTQVTARPGAPGGATVPGPGVVPPGSRPPFGGAGPGGGGIGPGAPGRPERPGRPDRPGQPGTPPDRPQRPGVPGFPRPQR
jgi:type II secretory pathway pseudopilin PulG